MTATPHHPSGSRAADAPETRRCPWCGHPTRLDYVHGHAQCAACKKNIEPCCEGEQACPPRSPGPRDH